jgi:hypothetical protein
VPPTLLAAAGFGLRALAREPWLLAVGVLVALARRAALWPAWVVAGAVVVRAAVLGLARGPLDPAAPVEGVLAAVGSPRFLALVAGLWLAGAALGAALRVAYLAGALPTLGGAMAGSPGPRFAAGVAFGTPRVLAAAGLGLVADLSAALFGGTPALAALRISLSAAARGATPLLAATVALALTAALAVPLALSAVADAAVARAALRGEGPGEAFAGAAARFLARPGTFLLAAMIFGAVGAIAPGVAATAGNLVTGFARNASPLLLVGPQLMTALLATVVAAAVDLAWLGAVCALGCGEDRRWRAAELSP